VTHETGIVLPTRGPTTRLWMTKSQWWVSGTLSPVDPLPYLPPHHGSLQPAVYIQERPRKKKKKKKKNEGTERRRDNLKNTSGFQREKNYGCRCVHNHPDLPFSSS